MPPDSVLIRSLLWLLFNAPCYCPRRNLITEASYQRAKGGEHWKWLIDTSFQGIHDLTNEGIRASRDSLGMCGVATAWMCMLAGVGLAVQGLIVGNNWLYLCFLALVVLPVLLAIWHIVDARLQAKTEMVRRIFELERHMRQRTTPTARQRLSVVAHHSILAYMEEVLETCVSGTRPSPMPSLHAYKRRIQNVPAVENSMFPVSRGDVEAQRMCPKDDAMINAARGLKGETAGGSVHIDFGDPEIFGNCCSGIACALPTMRMPGRLRDAQHFCEYVIEVVLYKYGWQGDDKLRQESIQFTESQLREYSRMGRFWWYHFSCVVLFNFILAGGALVVFVATMDWRIYVPAFVVVAVTAVTSALILARQLPVWSIVDGLRLRSRLNVKYGVQDHEVSATTDMALRALDVSLRAFNDRGELQSCVYWSKLVPKRAGEVVSASGGLYELLEPGGLSSHMNPVSPGMSGYGTDLGSTKWQDMPEAESQPGFSEGVSRGYSYSASHSQYSPMQYSPMTLPIDEPIPLAAAAASQQASQQAASQQASAANSPISRSPDAQKWATFQQGRATLQLEPLPASRPSGSGSGRVPPKAPPAAPSVATLSPREVSTPATTSSKASPPKYESSGSSGMAMEPSFYGEACLRPPSLMNSMNDIERSVSNAYSAVSPGSYDMLQFTSIGSTAFKKRAAAHRGTQAVFGTTASPTASTCSRSTSSPTMAQIDRHVDAAVLALQALQASDISDEESVGSKKAAQLSALGESGRKSEDKAARNDLKFMESDEGIIIDLVNPKQPSSDALLSSGPTLATKAPQHTVAVDSKQSGNMAAAALSASTPEAVVAPQPQQHHAASTAGGSAAEGVHAVTDLGTVGAQGVHKPGGMAIGAMNGSQMSIAQSGDIFYDSLDFSLQISGTTTIPSHPSAGPPVPTAAAGTQTVPPARHVFTGGETAPSHPCTAPQQPAAAAGTRIEPPARHVCAGKQSPLQQFSSAGSRIPSPRSNIPSPRSKIPSPPTPPAKQPEPVEHHVPSSRHSEPKSNEDSSLYEFLPTGANLAADRGPGQAVVGSRDPSLQRHKFNTPPNARLQRPRPTRAHPVVSLAPDIIPEHSTSFPGPEASAPVLNGPSSMSAPRALGESAHSSATSSVHASSMHATPVVDMASGAISSANTIPDPAFVGVTLGELKESNLESESQFSAGAEDVQAVFSTLDVALLAGSAAGDPAEEAPQHWQRRVFQSGNPLYQEGAEEC